MLQNGTSKKGGWEKGAVEGNGAGLVKVVVNRAGKWGSSVTLCNDV
jgi:hypothetical protein